MDDKSKDSTSFKAIIINNEQSLSEEQKKVLSIVLDRTSKKNVFVTGPGGTGKSFLIRQLIESLKDLKREDGSEIIFAITASTGQAASQIGGITLHSWSGVGIANEGVNELYNRVSKRKDAIFNWRTTDVLIIDEISMIHYSLLEKLDALGRMIRSVNKPFGGIQLVLVGDFFQLPPVVIDSKDTGTVSSHLRYCFQSPIWNKIVDESIVLSKVFRQKDQKFIEMLARIRKGNHTSDDLDNLRYRHNFSFSNSDGIALTRIFSINKKVDATNEQELRKLNGETKRYDSYTWLENGSGVDKSTMAFLYRELDNHSTLPKFLELKVGAQVIHLVNDSETKIPNGMRGIVVGFQVVTNVDGTSEELPVVRFKNNQRVTIKRKIVKYPPLSSTNSKGRGRATAAMKQIPLKLSWAVTVHKIQGSTLERTEIDMSNMFEYHQAYVALSRCTTLSEMRIINFRSDAIKVDQEVINFYNTIEKGEKYFFHVSSPTNVISIKSSKGEIIEIYDGEEENNYSYKKKVIKPIQKASQINTLDNIIKG